MLKKQKIFLILLGLILLFAIIVFSIQITNVGLYNAGLDITIEKDGFRIRNVAKGSIAEKAGLQKGAFLIKVDQYDIKDLYLISEDSVDKFLKISGSLFCKGKKVKVVDSNNNFYTLDIPVNFSLGNLQVINRTVLVNIIIGISLIIIGGYFLIIGETSRNLTLFYLFAVFSGSAVVFSFFHSYWNYSYLLFRFIALDIVGSAAGVSLFLFSISYPVRRGKREYLWVPLLYIPFFVKYFLIAFLGYSLFGLLGFLIHIYVVLLISAAIISLIVQYKKNNAGDKRKIRWIFTGAIVSIVPYLIYLSSIIIMQQYISSGMLISLILIANISLLLFPLSIGIGIVNYGFFDIDIVLRKTFSLIILGIFYMFLIILFNKYFIEIPQHIIYIFIVITASTVGPYILKKSQRLSNKMFFIETQYKQDLYHDLGQKLIFYHDPDLIYQAVLETMKSVYLPEFICFFSISTKAETVIESIWNHPSFSYSLTPSMDNSLAINEGMTKTPGGGVVFPIIELKDKQIFLELGKKMDQDIFVQEDYNLLTTMAFQISHALKNSVLYEELQVKIDEKDLLIKEVHHRVKNNMQLMSSLMNLQAGDTTDPSELKILSESMNRIESIALIHEILYQSDNFTKVNMQMYVESIVANLNSSFSSNNKEIVIEVSAEDTFLNVDKAFPCGLILNELVSNSLKHSFSMTDSGIIRILISKESNGFLLIVEDNGIHIKDETIVSNPSTLGLTLVSILTDQVHGKLSFEQNRDFKKFIIKF